MSGSHHAQNELAADAKPKGFRGVTPEDMASMQRETEALSRDFRLIEESHGRNTLNLVLAVAYLRKFLESADIVRYLSGHFAGILGGFWGSSRNWLTPRIYGPDLKPRQACLDQTAAISSKTFLKISDCPTMSCILKD